MLQPGEVIDRYTVDQLLGHGGMAVVYRVTHNQLGSFHALKVLTLSGAGIRERLLQEGRVQASLRHPNVVAVTDVLEVQGSPGLIMEYVDGPSLEDWLKVTPPDFQQAEVLFRAILDGVGHAHAQGLVHRDLKPANVMLAPGTNGFIPKVADFGLAKLLADEDGGLQRTRSGVAMGTPAYMAPEQIRDAKNVDHRADMFSLGCILFELLCGRPPFSGPDVLSIFNAVASASFPPPLSLVPDLPARLHNAILGLLVVDRELRIQDCPTLLAVLDGQPVPSLLPHSFAAAPAAGVQTWAGTITPESGAPPSGAPLSGAPPSGAPMSGAPGSAAPPSAAPPSGAPVSSPPMSGAPSAPMPSAPVAPMPSAPSAPMPSAPSAPMPSTPSDLEGSLQPPSSPSLEPTPRGGRRWLAFGLGGVAVVTGAVLVVLVLVVAVAAVGLRSQQEARVRRALTRATEGELVFADLTVQRGQVRLDDVALLGRDGAPVVEAATLTLEATREALTSEEWHLDAAQLEGTRIDLRRDEQGWVLPEQTLARIRRGEAPSVHLGVVTTGPGTMDLHVADGALHAHWEDLRLDGVAPEPGGRWSVGGTEVDALHVEASEPIFRVDQLESREGTLTMRGLELWVGIRPPGTLDIPPALAGRVPDWAGGRWPERGGEPWYGLPRPPVDRLVVEGGQVHLIDRAHSPRPIQLPLGLERATVGPAVGQRLPVAVSGELAGGRLTLEGDLREDGLWRGSLGVRHLPLESLAPYLAPSLKHYGVQIVDGELAGRVDLTLKSGSIASVTELEIDHPAFVKVPGGRGPRAGADALVARRGGLPVEVQTEGSLLDPTHTPFQAVIGRLAEVLFAPAGGAIRAGTPPARRRPVRPARPPRQVVSAGTREPMPEPDEAPHRPEEPVEPDPPVELAPPVDEPAEPVAEEPVAEEPGEATPVAEEPGEGEPADEAPAEEEPSDEEPAGEEPEQEDPEGLINEFNRDVRDALNDFRLPRRRRDR